MTVEQNCVLQESQRGTNVDEVFLRNELQVLTKDNEELAQTVEDRRKQAMKMELQRKNAQSRVDILNAEIGKLRTENASLKETNSNLQAHQKNQVSEQKQRDLVSQISTVICSKSIFLHF